MEKGRPVVLKDSQYVYVAPDGKVKLQTGSDRRAVVNVIVDHGGRMTIGELNKHFGFNVRDIVGTLQRAGWLRV